MTLLTVLFADIPSFEFLDEILKRDRSIESTSEEFFSLWSICYPFPDQYRTI